jgi:hypothetical protein
LEALAFSRWLLFWAGDTLARGGRLIQRHKPPNQRTTAGNRNWMGWGWTVVDIIRTYTTQHNKLHGHTIIRISSTPLRRRQSSRLATPLPIS